MYVCLYDWIYRWQLPSKLRNGHLQIFTIYVWIPYLVFFNKSHSLFHHLKYILEGRRRGNEGARHYDLESTVNVPLALCG